jgi:hypothetical protein
MTLHRFRIFTLAQANALLPTVSGLTRRTQAELEALRTTDLAGEDADPLAAEADARELLDRWAQGILALGAQPKGVFTVDFRTPDPNVLWCWAPGEQQITHRHFTWESFKDRLDLTAAADAWPGRN